MCVVPARGHLPVRRWKRRSRGACELPGFAARVGTASDHTIASPIVGMMVQLSTLPLVLVVTSP